MLKKTILSLLILAATAGAIYVTVGVYDLINIDEEMAGYKWYGFYDEKGNPLGLNVIKSLIGHKPIWGKLDLYLTLINPSALSVTLTGYNLDVTLNDTKIANLTTQNLVELKGHDQTTITLPISVDFSSLTNSVKNKNLINDFANKNYSNIVFAVSGNVSGVFLKMPIKHSITITETLQDIEDVMNS